MGALPSGWLKRVLPGLSPEERLVRCREGGWEALLLDPDGAEDRREWTRLIQWLRDGPLEVSAVQAGPLPFLEEGGGGETGSGLASPSPEEREAALEEVRRALDLARKSGCPRILLRPGRLPMGPGWKGDLRWHREGAEEKLARVEASRKEGRDRALDRLCRLLHELSREADGAVFCLRNGFDLAGLDRAEDLAAVVEDLGSRRVRVWADVQAAASREWAGDGALGDLLDETAPFLEGVSLGDATPQEVGLLPGTGRLDLPLVKEYLKAPGLARPWVLEVGVSYGWDSLSLARKELEGL